MKSFSDLSPQRMLLNSCIGIEFTLRNRQIIMLGLALGSTLLFIIRQNFLHIIIVKPSFKIKKSVAFKEKFQIVLVDHFFPELLFSAPFFPFESRALADGCD